MYSNQTERPEFGRCLRIMVVLGTGAAMLGAHYREHRLAAPQVLGAANLLAGHPTAVTSFGWSRARNFRLVPTAAWGQFAALDSAERQVIYKLNRIDAAHLDRRWLVVPDSIDAELAYSPLPESLPVLATVPKFILVSRRVQAFGAYENGVLIHWGPTSTGKLTTPTDSGLFFTNWKSRHAVSTDDPSWLLDWYVNFMALKGIAFHQYDLPGRPASHGCVRLLEVDAQWLYQWTDEWVPGRGSEVKRFGTPVLVMGDYAWDAPAPWLGLPTNPHADHLDTAEIDSALAPHTAIIVARTTGISVGTPLALR
ncbi:MAG: L,D-transpeptidase [Gemmatimonadales bacterium]